MTCPNPECDEGLIRGTVVGCAVCLRPVTQERVSRAMRERSAAPTPTGDTPATCGNSRHVFGARTLVCDCGLSTITTSRAVTPTPRTPLDVGEREEVKRLAQEAQRELDAYVAEYGRVPAPGTVLHKALCRELLAYCSPDLISRLVAEVERAIEDRARLDWLANHRTGEGRVAGAVPGVLGFSFSFWRRPDQQVGHELVTDANRFTPREAIDAAIEAEHAD